MSDLAFLLQTWKRLPGLLGFSLAIAAVAVFLCSPLLSVAQTRSPLGEYEVSGPYHYGNLSVFLIHGEDKTPKRNIITLEKAMEAGTVKVYETGNVNELAIENLSPNQEVYVQAGDIVKGGRQDRTLGVDLTLAPKSGKVPIASFCVESGRWTKRGGESDVQFSGSKAMVASNGLRLAIKEGKNQGKVWEEVSTVQTNLSANIGVAVNRTGAQTEVLNGTVLTEDISVGAVSTNEILESRDEILNATILEEDIAVNAVARDEVLNGENAVVNVESSAVQRVLPAQNTIQERSSAMLSNEIYQTNQVVNGASGGGYTTSLQLSLENKVLIEEVEEYMAALQSILDEHDDVIGFAFVVNGEMKNADVYGSQGLFTQLWPKLLRAAATEALAHKNKEEEEIVGTIDVVRDCFVDANQAKEKTEKVGNNMNLVTRRSDDNVLFESQEANNGGAWIHRNYMKLE